MPASSRTSYGPRGVQTEVDTGIQSVQSAPPFQTSGPSFNPSPLPGLPDFSGIMAQRLAAEAARERRAQQLHDLQLRAMTGELNDAYRARRQPRITNDALSVGEQAQRLQLQAMQDEQRMLNSGPPLKMLSGFNINPGYIPDTTAMNARQRQAFLPDTAGLSSVGAVEDSLRRSNEPFDPFYIQRKALDASFSGDGKVRRDGYR